jgi:hypothetical protein
MVNGESEGESKKVDTGPGPERPELEGEHAELQSKPA